MFTHYVPHVRQEKNIKTENYKKQKPNQSLALGNNSHQHEAGGQTLTWR